MDLGLQDRVALVTGGTRGFGRVVAVSSSTAVERRLQPGRRSS